jgi:hypothetical protein
LLLGQSSFLGEDGDVEAVVDGVVEAETSVEGTDGLNLVLGKVEAADIKVLGKTVLVVGLGNNGNTTLGGPSEQDLAGRLAVLVGNLLDSLVVEEERGVVCSLHLQLNKGSRAEG